LSHFHLQEDGAILAMKRAEIARKFDEIVAFAEVEKFMDGVLRPQSPGTLVLCRTDSAESEIFDAECKARKSGEAKALKGVQCAIAHLRENLKSKSVGQKMFRPPENLSHRDGNLP
jgi:hypothetical protein